MNRRYLIHNPAFQEYCYRRFRNCTEAELHLLDHEERKMFSDESKLHKFCKVATKEQMDYLLTKIGVEWVQTYGPNEYEIAMNIFNTRDIYEFPKKRSDVTERMAESSIFATGSREAMMSLHMASQNAQTGIYNISRRAQELIAQRKVYNDIPTYNDAMNKATEAYDYFNKILSIQLNSFGWVREYIGVDVNEIRILSALFDDRTKAHTEATLGMQIMINGKWSTLRTSIKSLIEKRLVIYDMPKEGKKSINRKKVYYLITAIGIQKMIQYRDYMSELIKKVK